MRVEAGRFGQFLRTASALAAASVIWGPAARAQETSPSAPPAEVTSAPSEPPADASEATKQPEREVEYILRTAALFQFNVGFDGASPGDVSINRFALGLFSDIPAWERGEVRLGIDYEYSRYEFNNATSIIPGTDTPWEQMHYIKLYAGYGHQFTQHWGGFVLANFGVGFEEGAGVDDSTYGGLIVAAEYTFSPRLKIGVGVAGQSQIQDSAIVYPYLSIDWRITDEWRLANDRLALQNKLGLALSYKPFDDWTFSLAAWYDRREYRLNDNGPLPHGVMRDTSVPVMFVVGWDPDPLISLEVGAGAIVNETFDVINQQSNQVSDTHVDVPLAAMVILRLRF